MSPSRFASVLAPILTVVLSIACFPLVARGQDSTSSGSLTVVSRPSGAQCRIRGDRVLRGPTPLTLLSTGPGRYEVQAVDPAFEGWERKIQHDGVRNDTVWISLHPKTRGRAVLRSMALPGWGQFYSQHPGRGWLYMTGAVLAFGGSIAAQATYVDRQHEVDDAETLQEWEEAVARVEDARQVRNALQITAAAFWVVSVVDAALFFPHFERQGLSAVITVQPDLSTGTVRVAATFGF